MRTGLRLPFLEQFHTFGKVSRRNDDLFHEMSKQIPNINDEFKNWITQRFISTSYISLVDINKCSIVVDPYSELFEWRAINDLPNLIYDHEEMVIKALQKLKRQINYLPIGINLLPNKFLMKDLQGVYESILERSLDRGNFQKKMLKLNILERHEKKMEGGAYKAPFLYSFHKENYEASLKSGIGFMNK